MTSIQLPSLLVNPSLSQIEHLQLKSCPCPSTSWTSFDTVRSRNSVSVSVSESTHPSQSTIEVGQDSEIDSLKLDSNHSPPHKQHKHDPIVTRGNKLRYRETCKALNSRLLGSQETYSHLSKGIDKKRFEAVSSVDGAKIPVVRYSRKSDLGTPDVVVIYLHGGGLWIGDAESEEVQCRLLVGEGRSVYSVSYRLMPEYSAPICLADCIDSVRWVINSLGKCRVILHGSSSGGQLASLVAFELAGLVHGVMLRCPVTSDIWSGPEYLPPSVRHLHTTANPAFFSSISGDMTRQAPRDYLDLMPIEMPPAKWEGMPPTYLQITTNDAMYGDGICYAHILRQHNRDIRLNIISNFPHTFWLIAPELEEAKKAEKDMLEGLDWLLERADNLVISKWERSRRDFLRRVGRVLFG